MKTTKPSFTGSNPAHVVDNWFTVKQTSGEVQINVRLPHSVWSDFKTYFHESWKTDAKRFLEAHPTKRGHLPANPEKWGYAPDLRFSLRVGTLAPEDFGWDHPFNRPRTYGIASRKKRLEDLRKKSSSGNAHISLRIDFELWQRIQVYAAHQGVEPFEHIQLCLDYHAALYRRANAKKSPFNTFEKGLARDFKKEVTR